MINRLHLIGQQTPSIRPFTPAQAAQHAITSGNLQELEILIDGQHVHAATRTANGETLLMFATRRADPGAFNALSRTIGMFDINEVDRQGNTVLHHMAFNLTDSVMQGSNWGDEVNDFLEIYCANVVWEQANHQGRTVERLANELDRGSFLTELRPFAPDESDSASYSDSASDSYVVIEVTYNSAEERMKEAAERFLSRKRER